MRSMPKATRNTPPIISTQRKYFVIFATFVERAPNPAAIIKNGTARPMEKTNKRNPP